jgi:DNA-binding response OmpR family regulator
MVARLSIALVEDNDDLRELTAAALRAEGHEVVALSCAEELEDQAHGVSADVFLIDLGLPGEDGFSLARRIRQVQPLVGIIIVSARSDLQDKVHGYDSGADWYLPKPVPMPELVAALSSFARRHQARRVETDSPLGGFCLRRRELQGPRSQVHLTPSEEALLTAFARAPSGKLETWQLLELTGMGSADATKTSLEVRITRLRKKLVQVGAAESCLESIRGVGYCLRAPIQIIN